MAALPAPEQRALTPAYAYALTRIFPVFLRVGTIASAAMGAKVETLEAFVEGATEHKGSWWPDWRAWIASFSPGESGLPTRWPT